MSSLLASPLVTVAGEFSTQATNRIPSPSRSPQLSDPGHTKSHDPASSQVAGVTIQSLNRNLSLPSQTLAATLPETHSHHDPTIEQTHRAVGNLLDALRTNHIRPSPNNASPHSSFTPSEKASNHIITLPDLTVENSRTNYTQNMGEPLVMASVEEEIPAAVQTAQDSGQISAYAKLEFDDGPFYITTYSLELGRDARAYRSAKTRLAAQKAANRAGASSSARSEPSSKSKRDSSSQMKGSVVSERGGFLGVDDVEGEELEADEERKRQGPSQSSAHSASSIVNPKDLYTNPPIPHFNYQAYPIDEYERDIEEIVNPDPQEHEDGFLLPIHHAPVKDDLEKDVANHRSISRRHAKIFWEDDCFHLHIKGVNGAFVDEVHYSKDAIVPLKGDVSIQIKGIKFQFKLPLHSSIESSDESDQAEDESPNQNGDSSATSGVDASPNKTPLKVKIKNFKAPIPPTIIGNDGKTKRRGPGRPPKDGIMSKRERLIKERMDREAAAKAANGGVTPEPLGRPKAVSDEPKTKRKYTKRKSAVQEVKAEDDSEAVEETPPAKRSRVVRSESPEYPKLEDLDEKDLQRPPYNYSILIYDLLKDSPKPLDLKGIYRGLKMKWPHFLYQYKDPKGWESSVRHNVNEDKLKIIEKVDRVGKGYSYRAKPGVDIELHKKKRARSPPAPKPAPPRYQPPPPQAGAYPYPTGPSNHGMYGHLVPTNVPPPASYNVYPPPAPRMVPPPNAAPPPTYPPAGPSQFAPPNPPASQPAQPNAYSGPPPPPPPPGVSPLDPFLPAGLGVIARFESSLMDGVDSPSDIPLIQDTLASVRRRVFEGENASTLAGGETDNERTFLHYFKHILENDTFRNPGFLGWEAVRREKERVKAEKAAKEKEGTDKGVAGKADGGGDEVTEKATEKTPEKVAETGSEANRSHSREVSGSRPTTRATAKEADAGGKEAR